MHGWIREFRIAIIATLTVAYAPVPMQGMQTGDGSPSTPNYRLAARFAPYKVRELVHSTSIQPRWIEEGDRFWYEWESPAGKSYNIVDPAAGSKHLLFDNDRIAAELTRSYNFV